VDLPAVDLPAVTIVLAVPRADPKVAVPMTSKEVNEVARPAVVQLVAAAKGLVRGTHLATKTRLGSTQTMLD
jgi:hypothetical protein